MLPAPQAPQSSGVPIGTAPRSLTGIRLSLVGVDQVYDGDAEKQRTACDHKIADSDAKQLEDQLADEYKADRQQKRRYHRLDYDFVFLLFGQALPSATRISAVPRWRPPPRTTV